MASTTRPSLADLIRNTTAPSRVRAEANETDCANGPMTPIEPPRTVVLTSGRRLRSSRIVTFTTASNAVLRPRNVTGDRTSAREVGHVTWMSFDFAPTTHHVPAFVRRCNTTVVTGPSEVERSDTAT